MENMIISKKVKLLIEKSFRKNYKHVSKNWNSGANTSLSVDRALERVKILGSIRKSGNVLEIGSGSGILLACLAKKGYNVYGVEPDPESYYASKQLFKDNKLKFNIQKGFGEKLGFKSEFFDIIVSYQVIEHVKNPEKVFKESARVLKKNGIVYFVIPNYASFWEGHYGLIWFPLFWKPLAKIYLFLMGRNSNFLNDIKYITPRKVRLWCKKSGLSIVSIGEDEWVNRMCNPKITDYGNLKKLKKIVDIVSIMRLNKVIAYLGKWLHFYYPIILVARKK